MFLLFAFYVVSTFAQRIMHLLQTELSSESSVFANNLWKVQLSVVSARRLTTYEDYESLPHLSYDGK